MDHSSLAISFESGSNVAIARLNGDKDYKDMIYRLSLESSKHLSPPYNNLAEWSQDYPRQVWRSLRRRLGYPASPDVGILGSYLKQLFEIAKDHVEGEGISRAAASFPFLVGLYQEDINDAMEWAGVKHQNIEAYEPSKDVSSHYAANGFGLCSNYKDPDSCFAEFPGFPTDYTVNIQFTRNALIVELPEMHAAHNPILYFAYSLLDFDLGFDQRDNIPNYWAVVQERMESFFKTRRWWVGVPSKVFIVGDESANEEKFLAMVQDACYWKKGDLEIFVDDVFFMTAIGTAELAKREWYLHPRPR
jgi:hypothetical protein